jgi:hypothetical protein
MTVTSPLDLRLIAAIQMDPKSRFGFTAALTWADWTEDQ